MKVKFNANAQVKGANGEVEVEFAAGETYDLNDASARYWIVRGKAEAVDAENPAQQYMAEGVKAPERKPRVARSPDDEAAEKKASEAAKAAQAEQAKTAAAERKLPADTTEGKSLTGADSMQRAKPDALSSADVQKPR